MGRNDAYENEHQATRGRSLLDQLPAELNPMMLRAIATGQLAVVEAVAHA